MTLERGVNDLDWELLSETLRLLEGVLINSQFAFVKFYCMFAQDSMEKVFHEYALE